MPNLRIVSDNALERAATFTASSRAGTLVEANMLNWKKSSFWRATSTNERITALFATPEPIQFVGAAFCNWSPTAQMRVRVSQEASATNLLRHSEAFDNAVWTKTNCTVSTTAAAAAGIVAPDGSSTVDKMLETATASVAHSWEETFTAVAGASYAASILVRSAERRRVRIEFLSPQFAANERAVFDATSGTIPSNTGGSPIIIDLTDVVPGMYRCAILGACTTAGTATVRFTIMPDSGTSTTYTGATTSGIYAWGAMVTKDGLSSYYPSGSTAGVRPAGYIDAWQSYDYDSGLVPACPWPAPKLRGFAPVQAASAYAYGGGTYARHWLPAEIQARGIAVDIADPDNVQGYLEVACLVAAPYWSPKYNASAAGLTPLDGTDFTVTGGGDTYGTPGFVSKELAVDLSYMEPEDGLTVMDMALNSAAYPLFLSLCPNDSNPARERKFMALAHRSKSSAISMKYAAGYTTSITFKEV